MERSRQSGADLGEGAGLILSKLKELQPPLKRLAVLIPREALRKADKVFP